MNLTAIQTWAIVAQTIVFSVQTFVLFKTLGTVNKQAAAADAQAEAAENQANMAIKQMYANIAQADQSVRPLITVRQGPTFDEYLEIQLLNEGLGPAFQLSAFLEERMISGNQLKRRPYSMNVSFLGVGNSTHIKVTERKIALQHLVVEYESAMHATYESRFFFGEDGEYHLTVPFERTAIRCTCGCTVPINAQWAMKYGGFIPGSILSDSVAGINLYRRMTKFVLWSQCRLTTAKLRYQAGPCASPSAR